MWGCWFTYLHMHSYQSLFLPVYVYAARRGLLRRRWRSFPAVLTSFHLFVTGWREVTWPPLCLNWKRNFRTTFKSDVVEWRPTVRRRARSWCNVCCGWYDWRRPLSRPAVLFATPWHCRELSDEWYAHHIQFEFWLLRRLTPAVTDRPPTPAVRSVGVVYYAVVTTRLLLSACC